MLKKTFNITLQMNEVKPVRKNDLVCFQGDSIIINIKIIKDKLPVNIQGSKVIITYNHDNQIRKQNVKEDGSVEIINDYNGIISIKPSMNNLFIGTNIITISLKNENDEITIQPFILNVYNNNNGEFINKKEDIITVSRLCDKINNLELSIDKINKQLEIAGED